MSKVVDIRGQKFNRLFVVSRAESNRKGRAMWNCRCDCGNPVVVESYELRSGHVKSCGCLAKEVFAKAYDKADYRVSGVRVSSIRKKKCEGKTSKYKGVSFDRKSGKWQSNICIMGRNIYLGRYDTEGEAYESRRLTEKILHRPFLLMEADLKKKKILTDRIGFSEEEAEQLLENEWLQNQIQKALEYIEAS